MIEFFKKFQKVWSFKAKLFLLASILFLSLTSCRIYSVEDYPTTEVWLVNESDSALTVSVTYKDADTTFRKTIGPNDSAKIGAQIDSSGAVQPSTLLESLVVTGVSKTDTVYLEKSVSEENWTTRKRGEENRLIHTLRLSKSLLAEHQQLGSAGDITATIRVKNETLNSLNVSISLKESDVGYKGSIEEGESIDISVTGNAQKVNVISDLLNSLLVLSGSNDTTYFEEAASTSNWTKTNDQTDNSVIHSFKLTAELLSDFKEAKEATTAKLPQPQEK